MDSWADGSDRRREGYSAYSQPDLSSVGVVLAPFLFEMGRGLADRSGVAGRRSVAGLPDSRFAVHDRERRHLRGHSRLVVLAPLAVGALHRLNRSGGPVLGFFLLAENEQPLSPLVASGRAILFPRERDAVRKSHYEDLPPGGYRDTAVSSGKSTPISGEYYHRAKAGNASRGDGSGI